jgi:ribosomal-protein-alanine N-acetyltransferase
VKILTERLELIATTEEMVRAEIHDREEFARLVRARIPAGWPPPLNDQDSMQWTLRLLLSHPGVVGYAAWYLALPDPNGPGRTLVGQAGFKGPPDPDGTVEVGYSVMEDRQRNGYGTEATGALIQWAFSHPEVHRVVAETYPHMRPSLRVMERNGMTFMGTGSENGVVRFGIERAAYEASCPERRK